MASRFLFLGTSGAFSGAALRALAAAGRVPAAIALPGDGAPRHVAGRARLLPLAGGDAGSWALARGLAVWRVGRLADPSTLDWLDAVDPDAIAVACWPWRLPPSWLARRCLNAHPSLLPAYRGPEPLFWQLQAGETRTGVTVHVMAEDWDAGPIAGQREVPLADGLCEHEVDLHLGAVAGLLLADALGQEPLRTSPQPAEGASHQPRPEPCDTALDLRWAARRVFNFVRGAQRFAPFPLWLGGRRFDVWEARAFDPRAVLGVPWEERGGALVVQLTPGTAELAGEWAGA